ncbi:TERF1-interacting nuclear factor 2 isoform X2 [Tachyglossus aculeatus]|uniref:TERF1-interacting nuclear factor 2 isoform X2 n=1 Tax=Tachyglossus aculeatus TaxID=9261 RepID=UPI0018F692B1|nr:TERF1-interacting nuclear factor 2 isoform X2 [Tachyglossus aculeatus]
MDGGPAPLRLAAAAAWRVVRMRRAAHYPRVLQLLSVLDATAPGLVRYRHHARLCLGLRAKMVVELILGGRPWPQVLDALNHHFPQSGPAERHPNATERDLVKIREAQDSFCELICQLAESPAGRGPRLQDLEQDYGEPFLVALEKLLFEYLCQLEMALPALQPRQLQKALKMLRPGAANSFPLALGQYCTDLGWPPSELPAAGPESEPGPPERNPAPAPLPGSSGRSGPGSASPPRAHKPRGLAGRKRPEAQTGRDFNLAPLGRRRAHGQQQRALARAGQKERPTAMLSPFRSLCLPAPRKDRVQPPRPGAGPAGARGADETPGAGGRRPERVEEPLCEHKENLSHCPAEPPWPALSETGVPEPGPALDTLGDLVLDSEDEGNGQRAAKASLEPVVGPDFPTWGPDPTHQRLWPHPRDSCSLRPGGGRAETQ